MLLKDVTQGNSHEKRVKRVGLQTFFIYNYFPVIQFLFIQLSMVEQLPNEDRVVWNTLWYMEIIFTKLIL